MDLEQLASIIALTLGVGWASGINLYAAVAALGVAGASGYADLPQELAIIESPVVIAAAGFMYFVEFFADKIPGIDTGWDALHTFVRIPAGALLASNMVGDSGVALELAAGLVGGGLAATSHVTKAGSRVLINTSPEPFTNWGASIAEDISVFAGIWAMLNHPVWFIAALLLFILLLVWLLPKIWRAIIFICKKVASLFGGEKPAPLNTPE